MNAMLKGAAAMSLASLMSSAAFAQDVINFGIISTESQQNLERSWQPLLDDMAEKTGLEVRAFFASDYAGIIEGMRFGQVQLAWYGNKSAMEAVDRAEGEVFAQSVPVEGEAGYYSVVIVPQDSPLQSLDDLLVCDQSLDFGLGDPNSTSGYLVPMTFVFSANSVNPQECFANVTNANHETNAMTVANGQLDAAANNTENMALIEMNQPQAFANLREIWRSPLIPSDPLVWRKDLSEETKDLISNFFLTYGTDETDGDVEVEREVLAGLQWAPFRPSTDAQLLPIRIMELTGEISVIEADESLSDEEKTAQVEELTAQIDAFEAEMNTGN